MAPAHRAAPVIAAVLSLLPSIAAAQEPPPAMAPPAMAPPAMASPAMAPPPGIAPLAPGMSTEVPSWANPRRLDYEEGDPIPPRYGLKTRANRGLLIGGMVTFGTPYIGSFISATILLMSDDSDSEGFGPMLIPVAGPIITISTAEAERAGIFWLAANSVMQTAGVVMMAAAFGSEDMYLERQDGAASPPGWKDVALRPTVMVGPGATALRWRF